MLQVPPSLIAATLDRTGIVSIETQELAEEDEVDLTSPNDRQSEQDNVDATTGYSSQYETDPNTPSVTLPTPSVVSDEIGEDNMLRSRPRPNLWSVSDFPLETTPRPIYNPAPLDIEYRSILDNVVSAARRFIFPTRDSIDTSPLAEFQNLRVFEVLSHLNPNPPGFSRENWQSTIRKYVRLHEDYTDLKPWGGRETADLVYTDSEGTLTSFLVAKDYLSSERWAGKRLRFYLEVKSTTSTCETPFYMSKYQYERMQTFSEDEPESSELDAIYIIFRVFNIGTDSVSMRVYVDPERMRRRRHLVFTAETWSIVPGSSEA
ncbi:hypothetical protein CA14_010174 [Aspergillus flavus]|uniref:Protein NO VEIN C-terminal domain-containing protein n=1 Tax=Aspergillus flavus TaxID=5059 RepID=A0AB74C0R3_ASPFL|nr:hypothetical protein CA14_010174 [Aspergillus flavus]